MAHRITLLTFTAAVAVVLFAAGLPRGRADALGDPAPATAETWKPWDLGTPALRGDGRPVEIDGWKDLSCARCHAAIAAEWAGSTHALAWISEPFQEQIADMKRPDSCHGCHAPVPLVPAAKDGVLPQKPAARDLAPRTAAERDQDAHFGVTCASCHEGPAGAVLGPFGAATPAHASVKDPRFTAESKSELCIACHATTVGPVLGIAKEFVDTDQAAKGKSCVGCHMQPLARPIAAEEGRAAYAARSGRSHALQSPRAPSFLRRAFRFEARVKDGATVVTVHNECGHRVPGLIGREIALEATLVGGGTGTGKLVIDRKTQLAVDGDLEIRIEGVGARVHVTGTHADPGFDEPDAFLDVTVDVAR